MNNKTVNEFENIYKVMLIGDSGSGKTSLLLRFCEDTFCDSLVTLAQNYREKIVRVRDKNYKFIISDSIGQERFRTICHSPYRGVVGIMVVFDITNDESFDNVKRWIGETERYCYENVPVIICQNKMDLIDMGKYESQVSEEKVQSFKELYCLPVFTTSAKYNINVEASFIELFERVLESRESSPPPPKPLVVKNDINNNKCNIN